MLWVEKIPRTIGTTAAVYAVCNQLGGIFAYPRVWVRNCLLVVFGIVSRIPNISCDIFGIYRSMSTSIIFSGYLDADIMRCIEWYRYDTTSKYTPQVDYQKVWRVCSFGSRDVAWNKASVYKIDLRKYLAACVLRIPLLGCMKAHQFDARRRQGRKLNHEHLFFSRLERRHAR